MYISEKELVTFKSGLILKELNCNISSSNYFVYSNRRRENIVSKISYRPAVYLHDLSNDLAICLQPTKSNVQTWLREKQDIEVIILRSVTSGVKTYYAVIEDYREKHAKVDPVSKITKPNTTKTLSWATWSAALSSGIDDALKLLSPSK